MGLPKDWTIPISKLAGVKWLEIRGKVEGSAELMGETKKPKCSSPGRKTMWA
jgi:hypothetical protein